MTTLVFTGGHHNSSLEVAKRALSEGYSCVWFGHLHSAWKDPAVSSEYKDVTAARIPFFDLKAGKLYKTKSLRKLIQIPLGFFHALVLIKKTKPKLIVSFGGYLAVPVVFVAWLFGIPSITHEQTVTIGWANRFISHFVNVVAITWPESQKYFPKQKTVLTGLPIRTELLTKTKTINSKKTIYITGGKQGAHIINQVVFEALHELTKKYHVIHQTGNSELNNDQTLAKNISDPDYEYFDYSSEKAIQALVQSDLVIGRSGAHSTYELAILGKRCVLVPIPWVSHQEQLKNAKVLVSNGNGIIISESDLNTKSFLQAINDAFLLSPTAIKLPTDATEEIIKIIKSICEP